MSSYPQPEIDFVGFYCAGGITSNGILSVSPSLDGLTSGLFSASGVFSTALVSGVGGFSGGTSGLGFFSGMGVNSTGVSLSGDGETSGEASLLRVVSVGVFSIRGDSGVVAGVVAGVSGGVSSLMFCSSWGQAADSKPR